MLEKKLLSIVTNWRMLTRMCFLLINKKDAVLCLLDVFFSLSFYGFIETVNCYLSYLNFIIHITIYYYCCSSGSNEWWLRQMSWRSTGVEISKVSSYRRTYRILSRYYMFTGKFRLNNFMINASWSNIQMFSKNVLPTLFNIHTLLNCILYSIFKRY